METCFEKRRFLGFKNRKIATKVQLQFSSIFVQFYYADDICFHILIMICKFHYN